MEKISAASDFSQKNGSKFPSIQSHEVGVKKNGTNDSGSIEIVKLIGMSFIVVCIIFIVNCLTFNPKLGKKCPPNPKYPLGPSPSKLHIFSKAAVCTHAPPCSKIGRNILQEGGSAVDAAIAAMVCNGVWAMQSMGLGGGFQMIIYSKKENKAYALNAREKAPMKYDPDMYRTNPNKSINGPLSIGVPGEVMGYYEAHKRFGKLTFAKLIEPSIELCYRGIKLTLHTEMSLLLNSITNDENLKFTRYIHIGTLRIFANFSPAIKLHGSFFSNQQTFNEFSKSGFIGSKQGYVRDLNLANAILWRLGHVNHCFLGCRQPTIIAKTIMDHRGAQWMKPIRVSLQDGNTFYSVPPPGSGVILGFILNILNNYNFTERNLKGHERTILTYHRIIEAFKYAHAMRTQLGDMDFVNISSLIQNLTSKEYGREIYLKIEDHMTHSDPKDYGGILYEKKEHGTSQISVMSEDGDAVSVTSSVNFYFGCGYTSNRTGIVLNSVMNDFSFPYFRNYFGIPGSPNMGLEPGKRPISSMSPAIIIDKNNNVKMVMGASGGNKITSTVAQVIMRCLWFGQNIKEAIDAPYIYHHLYPMKVMYNCGLLQQVIDGLEKIGHETQRNEDHGNSCGLVKNRMIYANSDFRKFGSVYGIN